MNQPTYLLNYMPCCKCGALTQVRQVYDKHLSTWVDSTIRICYDCRKKEEAEMSERSRNEKRRSD